MKRNTKILLFNLVLPLAVGGLSALLSGGMGDYKNLNQPPLSPPAWVFPLVWSVLYLLMGYAAYRVAVSERSGKGQALRIYGAQLALNFLWSIVFFGFNWYLGAFVVLVALWILIYLTMQKFAEIDKIAGDLLIPYLLWVTFAGYLNFSVYLLN